MDHHCFFIAGCVGRLNYRYFLSYVFYAIVASIMQLILNHQNIMKFLNFEFDVS